MTMSRKCGAIALLGALTVSSALQAQTIEVITNGDFGASTAGYTSGYSYASAQNSLFGANEGKYGIGASPNYFHSNFIKSLAPAAGAPAPAATQAMIVNGYATIDSWVWAEPVQLTAGVPYSFSGWATSVLSAANPTFNNAVPHLQVRMTPAPISPAPVDCSAVATAAASSSANIAALQSVVNINPPPLALYVPPPPPANQAADVNAAPAWTQGTATVTPTATGTYCLMVFNVMAAGGIRQGNDFAMTGLSLTATKPVAVNDPYTTPYNTPLVQTVSVGSNDTSLPPNPVYSKLTDPTNGTVTFNPDGTFTYTPTTGFSGTDSFTYQVCSGPGNTQPCSDPATVSITVGNAPPVTPTPQPDRYTQTTPGAPVTGNVGGNDTNIPATPDYSVVGTPPPGLVFNPDGTFTYTPPAGMTGPVTFDYLLCSGPNATPPCGQATVTINLAAPPTAVPTVGWWGLMGLSALLGLFGMARRRRA